jgi:hypothetical protein
MVHWWVAGSLCVSINMAGYVVEGFMIYNRQWSFFRGGREHYRMQIDKMSHIFSEEEEDILPNTNWQNVAHFFGGGRGHYRMQIDKTLHIFSEEEEEDITECKLTKCCTFFQRRKRRTLDWMQIDKMLHIFSEEEEEDIIPNAIWQNVCMCKQKQFLRMTQREGQESCTPR